MSGWANFSLTELGHAQVRRLRARLMTEAQFAAVYSSPLLRALQTARPLSALCLTPVELRADLREIDCGDVDGLPIDEVRKSHPELWLANMRQNDDDFRWPRGESYTELRSRALRGLDAIARRHRGARVAVVTHAGVISQVVGFLMGTRPANWHDHRPHNTSLTELLWDGAALALESFDDHGHLASEAWALAGIADQPSTPECVGPA